MPALLMIVSHPCSSSVLVMLLESVASPLTIVTRVRMVAGINSLSFRSFRT